MAKADPGYGSDGLFSSSNKLRCKLTLLSEVILNEKWEVRRIGKEMRDLISKKEEETIRELDSIWKEMSIRIDEKMEETQKKIEEIEKHERDMIAIYGKMEVLFKDVQHNLSPLTQITEAVESVKRDVDIPIPYLKLTWRLDELRDSINTMCRCERQIREDFPSPYQLKWSKCEEGPGETELCAPCGIAINPRNDSIYVADNWGHRVQIFSREGEWVRTLKDTQMVKPEHILFLAKSLYVQCDTRMIKFNELFDEIERYKFYGFSLRGICTDRARVYVGNYSGMKIISLTLDLVEDKQITLHSEFSKPFQTKIGDLSLAQKMFYVLLTQTDYPIQAFSDKGILLRRVIHKDCIGNSYFFCLDQQLNIIISDSGHTEVKIFSNEGQLLTRLSRKEGRLTDLSGVVSNGIGGVFTVDWSQHNRIQAFSL